MYWTLILISAIASFTIIKVAKMKYQSSVLKTQLEEENRPKPVAPKIIEKIVEIEKPVPQVINSIEFQKALEEQIKVAIETLINPQLPPAQKTKINHFKVLNSIVESSKFVKGEVVHVEWHYKAVKSYCFKHNLELHASQDGECILLRVKEAAIPGVKGPQTFLFETYPSPNLLQCTRIFRLSGLSFLWKGWETFDH